MMTQGEMMDKVLKDMSKWLQILWTVGVEDCRNRTNRQAHKIMQALAANELQSMPYFFCIHYIICVDLNLGITSSQ
jgi:hypothetical protein